MKSNRVTNILVTILIILVVILISLQLKQQGVLDGKINSAIANMELPEQLTPKDGQNGYTPVKGVDYVDGKDGKDSISTHTKEKETIVKEVQTVKEVVKEVPIKGQDGLTPEIQCNTDKNRWEVKNSTDNAWRILNGTPVKCTIDLETLELLKKGL